MTDPAAVTAIQPASRQKLFERLAELGIETVTVEHRPLFTVADSADLERELPGAHTKNLFLKDDKGALFLVVAQSTTKVDLKRLSRQLGAGRFSFGKPELLLEVLGVTPGSVTAFAVMNDDALRVRVVIDAALMAHDTINCHPLENTATTSIAREDLLRFMRAGGHQLTIETLSRVEDRPPP
ncbi:prolyl-tRNA synthetase associated domain-containing protein [Hyphomicrobium sulfonivorans]|uniref:prolyl-tRNA synthetase associated domain-containing protein n=1 Tax=Hyphomicrobium sulfonivorans TaxID=121290 RepID=UPI000837EABC|nr:prolyl-tRNA synthetase associated domain-containing protein [Hyphomicrobium sulfonivorans]